MPTPLTEPGWGAVPALLGVALAALGLFALDWVGDQDRAGVGETILAGISEHNYLSDANVLVAFYVPRGAIIAFLLAASSPSLWTLGAVRSRYSAVGLTRRSLMEGNVEPTRVAYSVIVGLCLLYHVISLLMLSASVGRHGHFGPGPWLLLLGTALSLVGTMIGPHVPEES